MAPGKPPQSPGLGHRQRPCARDRTRKAVRSQDGRRGSASGQRLGASCGRTSGSPACGSPSVELSPHRHTRTPLLPEDMALTAGESLPPASPPRCPLRAAPHGHSALGRSHRPGAQMPGAPGAPRAAPDTVPPSGPGTDLPGSRPGEDARVQSVPVGAWGPRWWPRLHRGRSVCSDSHGRAVTLGHAAGTCSDVLSGGGTWGEVTAGTGTAGGPCPRGQGEGNLGCWLVGPLVAPTDGVVASGWALRLLSSSGSIPSFPWHVVGPGPDLPPQPEAVPGRPLPLPGASGNVSPPPPRPGRLGVGQDRTPRRLQGPVERPGVQGTEPSSPVETL